MEEEVEVALGVKDVMLAMAVDAYPTPYYYVWSKAGQDISMEDRHFDIKWVHTSPSALGLLH